MKKRVLFLARLFAPHVGGVETHAMCVAKELEKRGNQLTVLTEQSEPGLEEWEVTSGIEIIRLPKHVLGSKFTLWKWIWSHRELFVQADIIHVHDVFWWTVPVMPLIKQKYFITFHGWEGIFPIKKTAVLQRQAAAKLAKGVIQVGEYIEKWYGTRPDIMTYGAVDQTKFHKKDVQSVLKRVWDAARGGKFVSVTKPKYSAIFVGRLSEDNDIQKVIELFQIWKANDHSKSFLFVGDGELRTQCEAVGEVTGFVSDVSKYMLETNVVCANSYLSIMEAQAIGKLVCSFYSNPLKADYLSLYPGAKAMILDVSPQELFDQLQAVVKNPKKKNQELMEVKGWIAQQTWQKVAEQYEQLWGKV